jgi:hypothetical protein
MTENDAVESAECARPAQPRPIQRPARGSGSDDPAVDQLYSDGRLAQMPSIRGKNQALRDKLLDHIASTSFELGVVYTEPEVNERLMRVFDDYTALRRYLVDDGHLQRDRAGSAYQRPPRALA